MKNIKRVAFIFIISMCIVLQGALPFFEYPAIDSTKVVYADTEDPWDGIESIPVDEEHFMDSLLEYVRTKFGSVLTKEEAMSLKEFYIDDFNGDLCQLEYFPSLEIINISDYGGYIGDGWARLNLHNLREISLSSDYDWWEGFEFEEDENYYQPWLNFIDNYKLESIELDNVDIRSISASSELEYISIKNCLHLNDMFLRYSNITSIDLAGAPNLEKLDVESTPIKRLDLSKNPILKELNCRYTNIKDLDISNNPSLRELYCGHTHINKLDLSNNQKLQKLDCTALRGLKKLDLSVQKDLERLSIKDTAISAIDVSDKYNLNTLTLGAGSIAGIDLSNSSITKWGTPWPDDSTGWGFDGRPQIIITNADENGIVDLRKINPKFDYSKVWFSYSSSHSIDIVDEGFKVPNGTEEFNFEYFTGLYSEIDDDGERGNRLSNVADSTYSWGFYITIKVRVNNGNEIGEDDDPPQPDDPVNGKYTIGEDTWRFGNYEEELLYKDYEKFFKTPVAKLLSSVIGKSPRCYGLSTLIPSIKDRGFPENLKGKEINSLWKTGEVRQWIRYAHISQMLPDLVEEEEFNRNDYNGLYNAVKDSIEGNGDPVTIALLDDPHQILPVSILKDTDNEVWFNIYDPNYPDNQSDGEPVYSTFVLYGDNGNYTNCKYYFSRELGADNPIAQKSTEAISYTTRFTDVFIQAYKSKTKIDFWEWSGAEVNTGIAEIGRLLHVKQSSSQVDISNVSKKYPIHLKDGEDSTDDSSLLWIRDDDDEITVEHVDPGNEITIASDESSICIRPSNECKINFKVNDNQTLANISMDKPGEIDVKCMSGDNKITVVSATIEAERNASFNCESGEITASGISSIDLNASSGLTDDLGEVQGKTEHISNADINPDGKFALDIEELVGTSNKCSSSHSYGPWKITKAATFVSTGTKERKCSACGHIEKVSIPKLAKTSISKATVTKIVNKTYTGKNITQSPIVRTGGKTLKAGIDYKLSYKNNKAIGKATVSIVGIGKYTGTIKKSFYINPKGTSLTKVSAGKRSFTVKWKKQARNTTGYQIQYSTNKHFKSRNKIVSITKNKAVFKKVSKLKQKKKYYVRIRTYKTVSGIKYYSGWSKTKVVATK